jgi:3-oxoacyl-[acyl-carrier-protein] synthase-1
MAMENAFAASGINPGEVDYVNAHATSTLIGDISEARALRSIFGEMGVRPAVSSTKALTGHGLSLAGAMEAGFSALTFRHGFIPGSAHITNLDPACEGLNIIRSTITEVPRVVLKSSSGFGGANVALLMRRT